MKKYIPHIITLTSLCLGIISIIESCNLNFNTSSYLIFICLFLDAVDGSIARYLNTNSEFGKQLDSISDMIAFGLAPGILIYNFMDFKFENSTIAFTAFIIPICSSLRLAKYNITNHNKSFKGVTTPVNAIFFSSLPLINSYTLNETIYNVFINQFNITLFIIIMSLLLISSITTFSIRIDEIRQDKRKLFFIFISLSILFFFEFTGLPIIVFIYILLSILKIVK
ncbi:MAG: CDP-diacylglycerol--serine O-phosphatidyltransferase [Flavobacteriales bacterium]|nr:CDP-diacylglycerol--serine O-phosphatidyltransferase [Flavobacteriales bacterium]|tara:strand:+ start:13168 stop:13842 length:675 start_codon:yes stop_codon:yes gene_type:complete